MIEFAVQMRGPECEKDISKCLESCGKIEVDVSKGSVLVQTSLPWIEIQERIESTGKKAVLTGFGSYSAVAMINTGSENVKGVVRFTSHESENSCIVDGVIDGLNPNEQHTLQIHECGDLSRGFESVGNIYQQSADSNIVSGDLALINSNQDGRAKFKIAKQHLSVLDIIGRSLVVKQISNNFHAEKLRTSCGIIARAAGIFQNYKKICACDGVTIWDERNLPLAGSKRQQK